MLLSKGSLTESGGLAKGRHCGRICIGPKPSYLFVVVVGNLAVNEATVTIMGDRRVYQRVFSVEGDIIQTE